MENPNMPVLPTTPPPSSLASGGRRFGQVLDLNSPPPAARSSKKVKARRNNVASIDVSSSSSSSTTSTTLPAAPKTATASTTAPSTLNYSEYSVSFEKGPIGLLVEPCNKAICVVQRLLPGGPAEQTAIQVGDALYAVNDDTPIQSYEATVQLLKNASTHRKITFRRYHHHHKETAASTDDVSKPSTATADTKSPEDAPVAAAGEALSMEGDTAVVTTTTADLSPLASSCFRLGQAQSASTQSNSLVSKATPLTVSIFSPSKVKELQSATVAAGGPYETPTNASTVSAATGTVLKTVYKSVAPTASLVATGSYQVGSFLSTKLGETLVGHSHTDFEAVVRHKQELLQELAQAKLTLETQQSNQQSLQSTYETRLQELQAQVDTSHDLQAELKRALEQSCTDHRNLVDQLEGLQTESQGWKQKAASLEQAVRDCEAQQLELQEQLEEQLLAASKRETQLRQSLQETETTQKALEATSAEQEARWKQNVASLEQQLKLANQDHVKLQQDLATEQERLQEQSLAASTREIELLDALHESNATKTSLEANVAEQLAIQSELRRAMETITAEKTVLNDTVTEMQDALVESNRSKTLLEQQVDALTRDLQTSHQAATKRETHLQSQLKTAGEELEEYKRDAAVQEIDWKEQMAALQQEAESARMGQREAIQQRQEMQSAMEQLDETHKQGETEAASREAALEQKVQDLEETAGQRQGELQARRQRELNLEQEVQALKRTLEQTESALGLAHTDSSQQLVSLQEALEEAREEHDYEVSTLQDQLTESTAQVVSLQEANESLVRTLKQRDEEVVTVNKQAQSHRSELDQVRTELNKVQQVASEKEAHLERCIGTLEEELETVENSLISKEFELATIQENERLLQERLTEQDALLATHKEQSSASVLELARLEASDSSLANQVADLQSALDTSKTAALARTEELQSEMDQLSTLAAATKVELQSKVNELEQAHSAMQHSLSAETEERLRLTAELANAQAVIKDKTAALAKYDIEFRQIQAEHSETVRLLQEQISDNESTWEQEAKSLQKQLADAVSKVEHLVASNTSLSKQANDLRLSLGESHEEEAKLRAEIGRLQAEMTAAVSAAGVNETRLENEKYNLQRQLDDATTLLGRKSDDLSSVMDKLDHAIVEFERLSVDHSVSRRELEMANSKIATLESEKRKADRQVEKLLADLEATNHANKGVAVFEAKLCESRSQVSDLQTDLRILQSSKATADKVIESLQRSNRDYESQSKELRDALHEKDSELSSSRAKLTLCNDQLEDLRADLEQRDEELHTLRQSLKTSEAQYDRLSERLSNVMDESIKEKDAVTADLIDARRELNDATARNGELERLLRSLRRNACDSDARLAALRNDLRKERDASKQFRSQAESTQQSLESTIESLSKKADSYQSLLERSQNQSHSLQMDAESLGREIISLTKQHEESKTALEEKESWFAQERANLTHQLDDERRRGVAVSDRLRSVTKGAESVQRELEHVRQKHEEDIRQMQSDFEAKMDALEEWKEARESDLKSLRKSREELKVSVADVARLEEALSRSQEEVQHLGALLDDARDDAKVRLEKLTEKHAAEIGNLLEERDDFETSLRKSDDQRAEVEKRLYEAEEKLMRAQSEHERLARQKNDLSAALRTKSEELVDLQEQLENLQNDSLNISDDSDNEELRGLSSSDLRSMVVDLEDRLRMSEKEIAIAAEDASRRSNRINGLTEDLSEMSNEIDMLVEANGSLERRIHKLRSDKDAAESSAASLQRKLESTESAWNETQSELEQQVTLAQHLSSEKHSLCRQIESKEEAITLLREEINEATQRMDNELTAAIDELAKAREDFDSKREEASSLSSQLMESSERVSWLETELFDSSARISDMEKERESLDEERRVEKLELEGQLTRLQQDCSSLRTKSAELEAKVETQRLDMLDLEAIEKDLAASVERERELVAATEKGKDSVERRLTESTRLVDAQRGAMADLEQRLAEAQRSRSSLSEQTKTLQETIRKLETASESTSSLRLRQLEEMEIKCLSLEEERSSLRNQVDSLHNDLRATQKQAADHQKANSALHARVASMKQNLESTKEQLRESRANSEGRFASSRTLQSELDDKQMEVDHLRAKVQVMSATVARLRGDHAMLQDAALKSEFKVAASQGQIEEISRLKSELHTQTSKHDSLSEAYRSQQQALALSQSLEEQLLRFVEEIVGQTDKSFSQLSIRCQRLKTVLMRNTDPLSFDPNDGLDNALACLEDIASFIPVAIDDLEEKRSQLKAWKQDRRLQTGTSAGTPDSKSSGQATSPIVDAFQKMKSLINEEVLSPGKIRKTEAGRLDAEHLQKVIHSLERQIDSLLADLQAANDALKSRDELFTDLEQLVSHHEAERDVLEERLQSTNALFREMEERLKNEVSWKEAAEKELAELRQDLGSNGSPDTTNMGEVAAGRMILRFLGNREKTSLAQAFSQWVGVASAAKAVDEQGETAAALALQLEATREKFLVLKRHLEKNRSAGRRSGGLDRIVEGYESA